MTSKDTSLSVHGSFSWGFTSNQKADKDKDKKKGESAPSSAKKKEAQIAVEDMDKSADESKEKEDEKKRLSKFISLKDIKMDIKKGEFISIIGDVGSGKSSLLQSIIGDLIYLP